MATNRKIIVIDSTANLKIDWAKELEKHGIPYQKGMTIIQGDTDSIIVSSDKFASRAAQMGTIGMLQKPEVPQVQVQVQVQESRKLTEKDLGLAQKGGSRRYKEFRYNH